MIQEQTMLNAADNLDACRVMRIEVLGGPYRRYTGVDDIIKIITKEAIPCSKVRKDDVLKAVAIRTKRGVRRPDGSIIRLDDNACVLLNNSSEQSIDTRIFGPIIHELRNEKFMRTISSASEVF